MPLEWTDAGRAEYDRRLEAAFAAAPSSSEVERAELRSRLEAELARVEGPIGADEVARFAPMAVLGWRKPPLRQSGTRLTFFVMIAVVVLPALATLVEFGTHMCGAQFFDPIPTWWHLALVCWVPISGVLGLKWSKQDSLLMDSTPRGFAIGLAFPVTILYGIAFLPLLPLSLFALMMGIGILGLTPVLCAFVYPALVVRLERHLPLEAQQYRRGFWLGLGACILTWVVADGRAILTHGRIEDAVHGTSEERADAIRWLRRHADDDVLARAASGSPGVIGPAGFVVNRSSGPASDVTMHSVRKVWFLVNGARFAGPLRSSIGLAPGEHQTFFGGFDLDFGNFDLDFGGEQVGAPAADLELVESRIDGAFDGRAGLAYLEWTLEFANHSSWSSAEARFVLDLPDEAVVSRATLWIEGEPREAAFAATAATRAAYRSVAVQQRKDPLLVTSQGDDRAFVQCAPVPMGGKMKVRVGMTVPLDVLASSSSLRLPRIASRNFALAVSLEHAVAVEARHAVELEGLAARAESGGRVVVEGRLANEALDGGAGGLRVVAPLRSEPVVAHAADDGVVVCEYVAAERRAGPAPIVVVDGSAPMADVIEGVGRALRSAFPGEILTILVVLDAGASARIEAVADADVSELLDEVDYEGGRESSPVLAQAHDLARERGTDVLWIAGPHPETFPGEELDRRVESHGGTPRLSCVQVAAGENVILSRQAARAAWECFDASYGLDRAILMAVGRDEALRRRWSNASTAPAGAHIGTAHLEDLRAAVEIEELARVGGESRARAVEIARKHHLVTAVSGAVVLENQAQYDAAGLAPGDAADMPSVPEPEIVALFVCALAAAVFAWYARRRAPRGAAA